MQIVLDDPFLIGCYIDCEIIEIPERSTCTCHICEHSLYDIVITCISTTLEFFGGRIVGELIGESITRGESTTFYRRGREIDSSGKYLVPSKSLSRSRHYSRIGRISSLEDEV